MDGATILTIRDGKEWNEDSAEASRIKTAVDMELKLEYLPEEIAMKMKEILYTSGEIAYSFYDLRKANISTRHSFELTTDEPVYHQVQRMAPKINQIVRQELDMILTAEIVTPVTSAWSFPVVIATRKDGKPQFCVEYRVLNRRMKADRFLLPKI